MIDLTISETADLLARRMLSPVELVRAHLAQIERLDDHLRCFITVTAEQAIAAAQQAEQAIGRGEVRGPLHGIPIAIKDLIETAHVRTTAGSSFLRDYVPTADAPVVQRLDAAGAISLGKLNMHEWAMSITNDNPHYGRCRNPWNVAHTPGGSSGGSAAALAARMCLGALGSDTGGSIRLPAAYCGVVGIKPTYGRVSTRGVLPLSWNLDHVGPMARCVRDVALLLQAMAGYDADDPYALNAPVGDYLAGLAGDIRGWRVALALDGFTPDDTPLHPDVVAAVHAAAHVLRDLGAEISDIDLPEMDELGHHTSRLLNGDALAYHADRLRDHPDGFGSDVLAGLRYVERYTAADYARARRAQSMQQHRFRAFFEQYDLLITPTTPFPAPAYDEPDAVKQARPPLLCFTKPFNLLGLPALSLPCGFSRNGLPLGLQIIGPWWHEARVLQAGQAYEQATAWHTAQPPLEHIAGTMRNT